MLTTMSPGGPVHVYVGTSLESVSETVSLLRRTLLAGLPALLALLALSIWVVIGRALRPVEAIRSEVATISARALDRRVPVPDSHDEVSRLAATMNAMLDRLEDSARRQRRFVADASHELHSPLAALRSQLEVALADPTGTDWPATARSLVADEERMERLVRDLLFLARHDESAHGARFEAVDLDDVVLEEVARLRATHVRRVDTAGVSAAPVRGRRDDLARLVRNLLANALEHATSRVWVEVASSGGAVRMAVGDDGPGVPAADRDRVFDRFYRADAARSPDGSGTGLGLAIARTIAEQHGGRLTLADTETGALFVVCLPPLEPPTAEAARLMRRSRQPDASGAHERLGRRQMWGPSEYESGGPHGRSK
jgi:signal transduction histidine kinase